MGRTACTEPQCLYNGALYLTLLRMIATRQFFLQVGYCQHSVHLLVSRSVGNSVSCWWRSRSYDYEDCHLPRPDAV